VAQVTPLSYQPAFDPYHTVFRMLRLRMAMPRGKVLHSDHFRILDYYLMFPSQMTRIRVQQKHRALRNRAIANAGATPYEQQPDGRLLFNRMKPFQAVAIQGLATRRYIDPSRLEKNEVAFVDREVPPILMDRVTQANADAAPVIGFLSALANEYELSGVGGLKDRTGLMEFRYDSI
jgi:hypothetical protein